MPENALPTLADLATRLGGNLSGTRSVLCPCPIHEATGPHTPSCIVTVVRGQLIAHCRSRQCDKTNWPAFRAAMALKADIVLALVGARRGTGPEGIRYDYRWPDGSYSWSKLRIESPTGRKTFRSGVWSQVQGWTAWSRPIGAAPLYGLREAFLALSQEPEAVVLIVEGEKDVGTALALNLPALSAADGTRWTPFCTETITTRLKVRRAVVVPDNDPAGVQYGIRAADALTEAGIDVAWLALPGLHQKGDLTDWVDAGGTRQALDKLIAEAPGYDPALFQWRRGLVPAGGNSPSNYRGGNDSHNIGLALEFHPELRGKLRFNSFRQRVEVIGDLPWRAMGDRLTPLGYRARTDDDITNLNAFLVRDMGFAPFNVDTVDRAMKAEANRSTFDEAVVWLEGIPAWDGTRRIDGFLQACFNAKTDPDEPELSADYLAMVSYMLFGQVVRRIHDPGCQADHSLMLFGNQGDGKDKVLRALFGVYLSESPPSLKIDRAADRARIMAGYLLIHDAEMASFGKASDAERKAALTKSHDKGRAAFARELDDVPRRAPWAFSGNVRGILADPTGDRRIWPIEVTREITDEMADRIKHDAPQLWAEAKHRVGLGEADWPATPKRQALLLWGQSTFRPEAFGTLEQHLDRYLVEEPIRPKPAPGDSLIKGWPWKARTLPLTALTVGRFFDRVLGEVVGVGGGRHADRRNVTLITVYLQRKGWTIGRIRESDVVADEEERRSRQAWRKPPVKSGDLQPDHVRGSSFRPQTPPPAPPPAPPEAPTVRTGLKGRKMSEKTTPGHFEDPGIVKNQDVTDRSNVRGSTIIESVGVKISTKHGKTVQRTENKVLIPNPCLSTPGHLPEVGSELFTAPTGASAGEVLTLQRKPCPHGVASMLVSLYHDAETLSIDIETTGLDARQDRIRTVQLCDGATVAVVVYAQPVPAREALEPLRSVLARKRLVAHPARFEGAWLDAAGFDLVLDDTALLWAAIHGGGNRWKPSGSAFIPISLADLAKETLGLTLDKTEQMSDWSAEVLTESQLQYAALDAVVTANIWQVLDHQRAALEAKTGLDIGAGYDDLRKSNALALKMERAGIAFDTVAHQAWTEGAARGAAPLLDRIKALEPLVQISSPHQLGVVVKRRLTEMDPKAARLARFHWPRTEKGADLSFSKKALAIVLGGGGLSGELEEFVRLLHDVKDLTGRLSLFGDGFRKHVGADGRLRGHFYAAGAVTGRYVSQAPNLQNIFEDFREYLVAPSGRMLVAADYSQLELRVLAALAQCPGMTEAFRQGEDYHDTVARNAQVTRIQAKRINFGLVYGQGVESLARELGVDQADAADYLDRWAKAAPGAWEFLTSAPERYARDGGIATARRWIDAVDDADASSKAGTRPRNYPIQGAAGDVLHRAMALLLERIGQWPGHVLPLLTIHDEIVLEADAKDAAEVARLLPLALTEAFQDILPGAPIVHLVFGGVGQTWLQAKHDGGATEKAAREAMKRPKMNGKEHPEAHA